jgi:hypothetical protein
MQEGTSILEKYTPSIFRVKVTKVGRMAGYVEVGGKEMCCIVLFIIFR